MMDEQATLTGGSLRVTSSPGRGTVIEVITPMSLLQYSQDHERAAGAHPRVSR